LPPLRAQNLSTWAQWIVMGGRGAGKTRTGAEWVRACALGHDGFAQSPMSRIAIIGETMADVRDVMIEGVSGILAIHSRWDRPVWEL
jgi:phage terminase large subunit-like protein